MMTQKNKVINKIRVRVIAFRDYIYDKEEAMLSTRFFNLPEEAEKLKDIIGQIAAKGGGMTRKTVWKPWYLQCALTGSKTCMGIRKKISGIFAQV